MSGGTQIQRTKLSALLKEFRTDADIRQVDLAHKLGKHQSYISKYESGEKTLDILEVKEVCQALGVKLSDFSKRLENLT